MKKVPKFVWTVLACLICIVVTAGACLLLSGSGASSDKYLEVIDIIANNFYESRDTSALEDASARAMVESLGDPSSYYMTVPEYQTYKLAATNQYIGIGVTTEFNEKYGYLTVTSVTPGSPADAAHIKVGNMIAAVDNTDVTEYSPEEFNALLQSYEARETEEERSFTLHLLNSQGGKADAKLHCELIYAEPVIYSILEKTLIGYIKILNFDDSSAASLKNAIEQLEDLGVVSLIFDVRDNTDGKPAELAEALDYLLPKGDMFLLQDASGKETTYSSGKSSLKLPMVVMTNENTSCAAEVFASVMQELGGVKIIGRKTAGNAQSQTIIELADGSAVRISKFLYLTPDKKSMAELGGVIPDISSYQIEDSDMDVQLEAAKDAVS